MRKGILAVILGLVMVVMMPSVAHAVIDTDYLNQPRRIDPRTVGEWHTLNNQPPKWIVIAKPYGWLTGICALWGARWDAVYQPFFQSDAAVEGFVNFYAMDSANVCRGDLPINMRMSVLKIQAVHQPYDSYALRTCNVSGNVYGNYHNFTRTQSGACVPFRDYLGVWLPGFMWMELEVTWQFDEYHPQHVFTQRTWAAELTGS